MDIYSDVYEPFNWTRFILLLLLMCVSVFYYSTQVFVVEAAEHIHTEDCVHVLHGEVKMPSEKILLDS